MKTPQQEFEERMKEPDFAEWYNNRPVKIQEMIKQYPFGTYKVKEGAPYAISCPGTIVEIVSYRENGEVKIIIPIINLQASAIVHIVQLPKGQDQLTKQFHDPLSKAITVDIDPRYLDPIK
jgi:hypothetical protein